MFLYIAKIEGNDPTISLISKKKLWRYNFYMHKILIYFTSMIFQRGLYHFALLLLRMIS